MFKADVCKMNLKDVIKEPAIRALTALEIVVRSGAVRREIQQTLLGGGWARSNILSFRRKESTDDETRGDDPRPA